jgi:hypothetical protein
MSAASRSRDPNAQSGLPLGRRLILWTQRILLGILAGCALVYIGDCAIFAVRGSPLDQVSVSSYMAAPLKGNKTEYYFEGSGPMPCALALFSQAGWKPCWYLRRHPLYAEKP